MAIADFALKFGLALKTFNLSRSRLAQTVGVDKSVVSRWASGVQVPSDHNLSLLTEAVARHRPGFERRDWDLDAEGFANRLDALDAGASSLALPDKPSIAVLPFQNMSGDPEQEYFTDGITEDIITELSLPLAFRDRPELIVLVQGQVARHPAGRPGPRRALCAGGQHPQVVESNSCDRRAC
jgi:transcriptional regulator with XRE-family HTH domain